MWEKQYRTNDPLQLHAIAFVNIFEKNTDQLHRLTMMNTKSLYCTCKGVSDFEKKYLVVL